PSEWNAHGRRAASSLRSLGVERAEKARSVRRQALTGGFRRRSVRRSVSIFGPPARRFVHRRHAHASSHRTHFRRGPLSTMTSNGLRRRSFLGVVGATAGAALLTSCRKEGA